MSVDILRRNLGTSGLQTRHSLHSQQPRQSRQFWAADCAITLIPSGNLVIFFSLSMQSPVLGWRNRESLQAGATVSAISAIFGKSAFYAISAISAVSAMSADILRRNLGNFGLQVWHSLHSQQPRQSRHFWAAVSAVTLFPSGNLVFFFCLSMQSRILGRQFWQSWQSWATVSAISQG